MTDPTSEPHDERRSQSASGERTNDVDRPVRDDRVADPDAGRELAPGEAPANPRASKRPAKKRSALREFVTIAAIALILSFLVKTFLVQPFSIPSQSMENTLDVGDRIIVSKFTPQHSPLHRGDVVVFEQPQSWGPVYEPPENAIKKGAKDVLTWIGILPAGGQHVVKRIIGMPGDKVVCDAQCASGGELKVNGVAIDETSYIKAGQQPSVQQFSITVPSGELWVMGDNRGDSSDSRFHDNDSGGKLGSVPISDVTGEVVAIAWPLNRIQSVNSHPEVFAKVPAP